MTNRISKLKESLQVHNNTDWTKTDALSALMWLENLEFQATMSHKATSVVVDELNRLTFELNRLTKCKSTDGGIKERPCAD
jgi:hypothetical protein